MGKARERSFAAAAQTSALMVGVLWLVFAVDEVLDHRLTSFGIVPRTEAGLAGILFSPLLHATWQHLVANSIPLFILLLLLLGDRHYYPYRTLAWIWLASGVGTWLIGRGHTGGGAAVVHIGASSIIFGLIVYLIVAGLLMGSWRSLVVAVLVFFLFGGSILGAILHPLAFMHPGPISWEGHLSGALAGGWAAKKNHPPRSAH